MMNKNDFTKAVWEKYNAYSNNVNNDKFFKKNIYEKIDYSIKLQTIISLILTIISGFGMVYAGNYIYEEVFQKASQKNTTGNINYSEYYGDFVLEDGRYYKKILTYKDYIECEEKYGNIVKLNEEDFKDSFIILILLEKFEEAGTYISDIGADEKTLYLELKKYESNETFDINNNVLSVKVDKTLNRDDIRIEFVYNEVPKSDEYINLEELPEDYSMEQAIKDNCFVLSGMDIVSNDKEQLDNFINKTQNGENAFIRIVSFMDIKAMEYGVIIKDLEFRDGIYLLRVDQTRFEDLGDDTYNTASFQAFYHEGTKILFKIKTNKDTGEKYYFYELEKTKEESNPNNYDTINLCSIKK